MKRYASLVNLIVRAKYSELKMRNRSNINVITNCTSCALVNDVTMMITSCMNANTIKMTGRSLIVPN